MRATDQALLELIDAAAPGGRGGSSGSDGRGGYHGSEDSGCSGSHEGPRGASGNSGNDGRDGSVTKSVVSASELSFIAKKLQGVQNLTIDGGTAPLP